MWMRSQTVLRWHWRKEPELQWIRHESAAIDCVIAQVLAPTSSAVDVGCHYGSMLTSLLSAAPRGRHVGFEADPGKIDFLRKKFPEVDVRNAAVCDVPGEIEFFRNLTESGYSSIVSKPDESVEAIKVPATTLDTLLELDRSFDLIKIDVEDAELEVLRGGRALIMRQRPVLLLEIGPSTWARDDANPRVTYDYLDRELGYDLYPVLGYLDGASPATIDELDTALRFPFKAFNWVATPRR